MERPDKRTFLMKLKQWPQKFKVINTKTAIRLSWFQASLFIDSLIPFVNNISIRMKKKLKLVWVGCFFDLSHSQAANFFSMFASRRCSKDFFLPPHAAAGIQTHTNQRCSSLKVLCKKTLPTELPWPQWVRVRNENRAERANCKNSVEVACCFN